MTDDPKPPFLVIQADRSFWVQYTPRQNASATLQLFEAGCFRDAQCYDETGGQWAIVGATLKQRPAWHHRLMPWRVLPVELHLGPRAEVSLEEVVARLAAVMREENEFSDALGISAAEAVNRFQSARTLAELIRIAMGNGHN